MSVIHLFVYFFAPCITLGVNLFSCVSQVELCQEDVVMMRQVFINRKSAVLDYICAAGITDFMVWEYNLFIPLDTVDFLQDHIDKHIRPYAL